MATAFETLPEMFQKSVARRGTAPALRRKVDGGWKTITYAGYGQNVRDLAMGLASLGVQRGDRVCILGKNSPEWAYADFASLHLGAAAVSIYDTLTAQQAAYIVNDAGAKVLFVEGEKELERMLSVRKELKTLQTIVSFRKVPDRLRAEGVYVLDVVLAKGQAYDKEHPDAFDAAWKAVKPDDMASLIYTSGTTGNPKGVILTHANFCSNIRSVLEILDVRETDETLSFLPLSHSFERMGGHFTIVAAGAAINYASSVEVVAAEMAEVKPTMVTSVPRVYEKIYAKILAQVEEGSDAKKKIFAWARATGEAYARLVSEKKPVPLGLGLQYRVADKLVFRKIRARVGGRLRFFVSGGSALAPHLQTFFSAAGLWILQGYGLTETSPVIALNTFDHMRFGSVGRPIPGVEVKIAEDGETRSDSEGQAVAEGHGEILTRGPHVMKGYYELPKETAEAIDAEGWFHTGDVGKLDEDGFLYVTDRKKELLVMSNGKKVPPQPIENELKGRWIAQAVLIGTDRNFVSALLAPNFEEIEKEAKDKGWSFETREELVRIPEVRAVYQAEVDRVNAALSRYEQVKAFALLPRELTAEHDELTPSLKVKRRVVDRNFAKEIESLYAGSKE